MFGVLFGWRKASKCKKVIKEAQCRLKLLKKKRHSIVKHLRVDTANLIKFGHEAIALDRAEQLIKDESIAVAYELIDNFCDFIRTHFSYIRSHKDCPHDINEAVSSLIYASARCGDLPELRVIRSLFEERYGHKLAMAAVELFPGNLVNQQIIEALNMKFVSDNMKHRMVNEIATDYCLQRQLLALEYHPNWQKEMKESNDRSLLVLTDAQTSMDERSESRVLNAEFEEQIILLDSSQGINITKDIQTVSGSRKERIVGASSSESLPRYSEEMLLVYLDDVVEFPPSKDEDSQDQRLFKFKTPTLSKRVSFQDSFDQRIEGENNELWSGNASSNSPCSSCRSARRKRVRRKLVYPESQSFEDTECTSYYAQPKGHRSSRRRKQQNKSQAEEESERIKVTPFASNCQDHDNEANCCGTPRLKKNNRSTMHCREIVASNTESSNEMDCAATQRKPSRRSCDRRICRQNNEVKGIKDRSLVDGAYLRTETMPLDWSKEVAKDEFVRSNSLPVREIPNHVHPKLPDYDDLAARFMALKREFLMNNKVHRSNCKNY